MPQPENRPDLQDLTRALVDAQGSLVVAFDEAGIVVACNPVAEQVLGWSASDLVGEPVSRLTSADFAPVVERYLADYLAGGPAQVIGVGIDLPVARKDGTQFPAHLSVVEVIVDGVRYFGVIGRDLTDEQRAAAELAESERTLRLLVDGLHDHALVLLDRDGHIRSWNAGAQRLFGFSADAVVGAHVSVLNVKDDPDTAAMLETAVSEGKWVGTAVRVRADGSLFDAHCSLTAIRDETGTVTEFGLLVHDVTEQRAVDAARAAAEAELQRRSRLEMVSRLTSGVAHDMNNMLTVIAGMTTLSTRALAQDPIDRDRVAALLGDVSLATDRAHDLVKHLMSFARNAPADMTPTEVDPTVERFGPLLRHVLGPRIDLLVTTGAPGVLVPTDRTHFEQILLNLASNAHDAMPDGGSMSVTTSIVHCADTDGLIPRGRWLQLCVSDVGAGMDDETVDKLYDPFFTTKGDAGTGLGMSTVYGAVSASEGFLYCASRPGIGTTVRVHLPVLPDGPRPTDATGTGERSAPVPGGGRVCLIEPGSEDRHVTAHLLAEAGYDVEAFPDAAPALEWMRRGSHVAAVVSDAMVPGISAPELRAQVHEAPVLFTSGFAAHVLSHHAALPEGAVLVEKPFTGAELARTLASLTSDSTGT